MTRIRRTLSLFFESERRLFTWLRPPQRQRKASARPRTERTLLAETASVPSPASLRSLNSPAALSSSTEPPPAGESWRPWGLLLSVGVHAVFAAALFCFHLEEAGDPQYPYESEPLTIRLRPPAVREKLPAIPAATPELSKEPLPPDPSPRNETTPAGEQLIVADEPRDSDPEPNGDADGGRSLVPAPSRLPLPLGVGIGARSGPGGPQGSGGAQHLGPRSRGKGTALGLYGGNGRTEGAVSRGLRWLAEHQDADGGWSAEGFSRHCRHVRPCSGKGLSEFDVGITALATLAFLGAGDTPEGNGPREPQTVVRADGASSSPYARNVAKALAYLLDHQDGSGAYGAGGDNYFYNHAIATLAMGEAFALTGRSEYRQSLEAALRCTVGAQQSGGGWDYTAKSTDRNDLSITGWQVLALRAAASAGVEVPAGVLQRTARFLDKAVLPNGEGIYANRGQEAGRRGINMVAAGLLSRLYLGARPEEQRVRAAADRLLREPPDWKGTDDWERTYQSYYYWYTATLALFHLGGDSWKAWNLLLQRALLPLQSQKDDEDGSWPPESSWIGISGGRVYSTAISVLMLETYYRYEPLWKPRRS